MTGEPRICTNPKAAAPARLRTRPRPRARGPQACLLLLALAACGTEPGRPGTQNPAPPAEVSCEGLEIRDPRSGGNLTCLACRHAWQWSVPVACDGVCLLIELTCVSTPGARLSVAGPDLRPLWEQEVHSGQRGRFCVPLKHPRAGLYTVTLDGDLPMGLTHFTGSIWINLTGPDGEVLPPVSQ